MNGWLVGWNGMEWHGMASKWNARVGKEHEGIATKQKMSWDGKTKM
jgi:hypothetical protein